MIRRTSITATKVSSSSSSSSSRCSSRHQHSHRLSFGGMMVMMMMVMMMVVVVEAGSITEESRSRQQRDVRGSKRAKDDDPQQYHHQLRQPWQDDASLSSLPLHLPGHSSIHDRLLKKQRENNGSDEDNDRNDELYCRTIGRSINPNYYNTKQQEQERRRRVKKTKDDSEDSADSEVDDKQKKKKEEEDDKKAKEEADKKKKKEEADKKKKEDDKKVKKEDDKKKKEETDKKKKEAADKKAKEEAEKKKKEEADKKKKEDDKKVKKEDDKKKKEEADKKKKEEADEKKKEAADKKAQEDADKKKKEEEKKAQKDAEKKKKVEDKKKANEEVDAKKKDDQEKKLAKQDDKPEQDNTSKKDDDDEKETADGGNRDADNEIEETPPVAHAGRNSGFNGGRDPFELFFYETAIYLEIAGEDRPECSEDSLEEIAELLSDEWGTMINVDPRLTGVFQLDTEICNKSTPNEKKSSKGDNGGGRRRQLRRQQRRRGAAQERGHNRDLSLQWYSLHQDYHRWSVTYGFDWVGVGTCRWCPPFPLRRRSLLMNDSEQSINNSIDNIMTMTIPNGKSDERFVLPLSDSPVMASTKPRRQLDSKVDDEEDGEVSISGFYVYSADTNPPIQLTPIDDFGIIDLNKYKGAKIAIVAESEDADEIQFDVDNKQNFHKENGPPFSIAGMDKQKMNPLDQLQTIGTHTVTARPKKGKWKAQSKTISFLVVDSSRFESNQPATEPELIDILEEDVSFELSYAVNTRYFKKPGHCLEGHMMYVFVDIMNWRSGEEFECIGEENDYN